MINHQIIYASVESNIKNEIISQYDQIKSYNDNLNKKYHKKLGITKFTFEKSIDNITYTIDNKKLEYILSPKENKVQPITKPEYTAEYVENYKTTFMKQVMLLMKISKQQIYISPNKLDKVLRTMCRYLQYSTTKTNIKNFFKYHNCMIFNTKYESKPYTPDKNPQIIY